MLFDKVHFYSVYNKAGLFSFLLFHFYFSDTLRETRNSIMLHFMWLNLKALLTIDIA